MTPDIAPLVLHRKIKGLTKDALFRRMETPRGEIFVSANAVNQPFGSCWPRGSTYLLDQIEKNSKDWGARDWSDLIWLTDVLKKSGNELIAWGGTEPTEYDDGVPVCMFTAVLVGPRHFSLAWIGRHVIAQMRGGKRINRTTPHNLVTQLRNEGKLEDYDGVDGLPDVLTRIFTRDSQEIETTEWRRHPADHLFLCSDERVEGGSMTEEKLEQTGGAYFLAVDIKP